MSTENIFLLSIGHKQDPVYIPVNNESVYKLSYECTSQTCLEEDLITYIKRNLPKYIGHCTFIDTNIGKSTFIKTSDTTLSEQKLQEVCKNILKQYRYSFPISLYPTHFYLHQVSHCDQLYPHHE